MDRYTDRWIDRQIDRLLENWVCNYWHLLWGRRANNREWECDTGKIKEDLSSFVSFIFFEK